MRNQRGEGALGVIFWLALLGSGIFAAVRIVPMKLAVMELHDFADAQCQIAGSASQINEAKLLDSIVAKAKSLDLPLDRKAMKFEVATSEVRLRMRYSVTVDLAVYQWVWDMDERFQHLRM